jgi:hypothetical protein
MFYVASTESPYVVSYIRTDRTWRPDGGWDGMEVQVRFPASARQQISGYVFRVGPKVVPIDQKHWSDYQVPEYGLPVAIKLDWENYASLKPIIRPTPGELVRVSFERTRRQFDPAIVASAPVMFGADGGIRVSRREPVRQPIPTARDDSAKPRYSDNFERVNAPSGL